MFKRFLTEAFSEILNPPLVLIPGKILTHILQDETKIVPILAMIVNLAAIGYSSLCIHKGQSLENKYSAEYTSRLYIKKLQRIVLNVLCKPVHGDAASTIFANRARTLPSW